jgi:hypothetical protein
MATIRISDRPSRDRSITVWRGNNPQPLDAPAAPVTPPRPPAPAVETQINRTAVVAEERKAESRAAALQQDGPQFTTDSSRLINRVVGKSEHEQTLDALGAAHKTIEDLERQVAESKVFTIDMIVVEQVHEIKKHGTTATLVCSALINDNPVEDLEIQVPVADVKKIVAAKQRRGA